MCGHFILSLKVLFIQIVVNVIRKMFFSSNNMEASNIWPYEKEKGGEEVTAYNKYIRNIIYIYI